MKEVIDNINYFLAKNKLNQIEKATKGLFELDETKENIDKIAEILNTSFYTYSKHERKEYIKALALFSADTIKLYEIGEALSVSVSTVKLDLKDIKVFLNESKLKLKYLSKIGLMLVGEEEKIRKAQLKFLMEYLEISKDILISKIKKDETLDSLKIEIIEKNDLCWDNLFDTDVLYWERKFDETMSKVRFRFMA